MKPEHITIEEFHRQERIKHLKAAKEHLVSYHISIGMNSGNWMRINTAIACIEEAIKKEETK
jgi:hypothetical protein